jgi:5-methyltetrahydrofolate--homocysteine methyltransferase
MERRVLIIGEKINSTRKSIGRAIEERNDEAIREEALRQVEAGAGALDVNCGTLSADVEPGTLAWLVHTVQSAVDLPLCLDSPNPEALAAALSVHKGRPFINSISGEAERYRSVLPLAKAYNACLIALGMDDHGIPKDNDQAFEVGERLVTDLMRDGIDLDAIYFDPLVRSVATSPGAVPETLDLMKQLSSRFPGLHFVSGLSNVSFGLPERRHLNRAFLVLSIAAGLDAVIMDPLDGSMIALIFATEALLSKDRFCMNYIAAHHEGKLKV